MKRSSSEFDQRNESKDFIENVSKDKIKSIFVEAQSLKRPKVTLTENRKLKSRTHSALKCNGISTIKNKIQNPRLSVVKGKNIFIANISASKSLLETHNESQSEAPNIDGNMWRSYNSYLSRKLQNVVLEKDKEKKEAKARETLVVLKSEYDELWGEHLQVKKEVLTLRTLKDNITGIDVRCNSYKQLAQTLQDTGFEDLMGILHNNLQLSANQMQLVGLPIETFKEAFEKKYLGLDSELYARLIKLNDQIKDHKDIVSDTAQIMEEVKTVLQKQEEISKSYKKCLEETTDSIVNNLYSMAVKDLKRSEKNTQNDDVHVGSPKTTSTPLSS